MATGAAATMLQYVLDGTISMHNMEIERRPYRRNCGCALHKLKGVCPNACLQQRRIAFPKKQYTWNECSLSIEVSKSSSQYSPTVTRPLGTEKMQMELYHTDNRLSLKDIDSTLEGKH